MRTRLFFTLFVLAVVTVQAQYTAIPDSNFEAALDALGYDDITGDNQVPTDSISGITDLIVSFQNIADLSGIEDFTALQTLLCDNNQLSSLDVSQNTSLTHLDCSDNQLNSLDVSQNTALTTLWCNDNQLTSLDVSQNTNLTALLCWGNQLTGLDVSQNIALTELHCFNNQLSSLDVSQNTALIGLYCWENQLSSLDISQNTNLTYLFCETNQLSSLDVSQNTGLTTLICSNNQLGSLDVSQNIALTNLECMGNQLTSLDVSQNTALIALRCSGNQLSSLDVFQNTGLTALWCNNNQLNGNLILSGLNVLTSFNAVNNPGLLCVQVDNEADANAGAGIYTNWSIDGTAGYSESCIPYTAIPDANFEAALDALGYDDIPGDHQVPTANISGVTYLNVAGQNIADLSGIEDFTALQTLYCHNNQLVSLDISQNTNLIALWCNNNQLAGLDVSQNTNLTHLSCPENPLGSLDVSQNTNLTFLICSNNQLASLDVSQNTNLTHLYCFNNQLSSLDVSQNTNLTNLGCYNNQLSSLDVSQNTGLITLSCFDNQLTSLDVSQNTGLTALVCRDNQLSSLDVSQNTGLITLFCQDNQLDGHLILNGLNVLTNFNATNNPGLLCVQVDNKANANAGAGIYTNWIKDNTASYSEDCLNPYTAIPDANFEAALAAYDDIPGDHQVPTANISGITNLDVSGQNIADLSGIEDFTALEILFCQNNQLAGLDLSQNTNLIGLACLNNQLVSLDVSQNTNLTGLLCNNNQLTNLDVSQNTNLTDLWCQNNPNLSCIEVANAANANAGVGIYANWIKDNTASYSENCGPVGKKEIVPDIKDQEGIEEESLVVNAILLYPNPFTDVINFKYTVKQDSPVFLRIYSATGEVITTLVQEQRLKKGTYHVQFDGTYLPEGIYLYRLEAGDTVKTGKIILKK